MAAIAVDDRSEQQPVESEERAGWTCGDRHRIDRHVDESSEHAGRAIDSRKRGPAHETFEKQPELREHGDVDNHPQEAAVNEGRREKAPPLEVGRPRTVVGAPRDERRRIAQRTCAKEHQHEDRDVRGDQCRRDDHDRRPGAKRGAKRLQVGVLPAPLGDQLAQIRQSRARGIVGGLWAWSGDRRQRPRPREEQTTPRLGDAQELCQTRSEFSVNSRAVR